MVTCLGHSTSESLSSWWLRRKAFRRLAVPGLDKPVTIAPCHHVDGDAGDATRLGKMLGSALAEALDNTAEEPEALTGTTVLLLLPRHLSDVTRQGLVDQLAAWLGTEVRVKLLVGGSGLAWQALTEAYSMLDGNNRPRRLVVASVDSGCQPERLAREGALGRLHSAGHGDGYIAAEGAACVVLEPVNSIFALPEGMFALHRPSVRSVPPIDQTLMAPDSAMLIEVISEALQRSGMEPAHIGTFVSDADGSAWRSRWESDMQMRQNLNATDRLRPAELLGQTGVCTGLLSWLLPMAAHQHRLKQVNNALAWSISPDGTLAANVLERSPH